MNDESAPKGAHESATTDLTVTAGTDSAREARRRVSGYVVVVRNGGRWTRAIYLSLHSANQAVERAQARGASPHLVLVQLVPVGDVVQ